MGTWQTVWHTIASDFSDLGNLTQTTRVVVRLLCAALLGALIGYERERRGKAAGMRTHILVSLGAALFVLVLHESGGDVTAQSRVVQGVIAGIGFLGAGTILNTRGERQIQGLTTAASIWLSAAIGVTAGLGREATAVLATVMTLVVLATLPQIIPRPYPGGRQPPQPPTTAPNEETPGH
jgi:putative Mg2+ transporter-C (MgtC) family protein